MHLDAEMQDCCITPWCRAHVLPSAAAPSGATLPRSLHSWCRTARVCIASLLVHGCGRGRPAAHHVWVQVGVTVVVGRPDARGCVPVAHGQVRGVGGQGRAALWGGRRHHLVGIGGCVVSGPGVVGRGPWMGQTSRVGGRVVGLGWMRGGLGVRGGGLLLRHGQ